MTNGSLMMQNAPFRAFCSTFDLHLAIIGTIKTFFGFLESCRFTHNLLYMYATYTVHVPFC